MSEENPFRPEYRKLEPNEVMLVDGIKDVAMNLYRVIQKAPPTRARAIAVTKLEEAVMWAVKGVTQ